MKVLVLGGAGDMGSGVVEALCGFKVSEILVGDINYERARSVSDAFSRTIGCNTYPVKVDALNVESLREVAVGLDVVVNAVGPFYKYGYRIAENLVRLGLNFVDICDDHDATLMELGLDQDARRSGVTAVIGMGWTPGLSNILAKRGSRELGLLDSIDIYWVGSAADSRGLAVVMHLFHALIGEVPMFLDGDPLPASPGGSRPPPSGLSDLRSDAHSSSFHRVPILGASPFRAGGPRLQRVHRGSLPTLAPLHPHP